MKKVAFNDLVIGKEYYTECGIWKGITTYVGSFQVGKRIKYRFTFGSADNWLNQFCHFCTKSNIKVYELDFFDSVNIGETVTLGGKASGMGKSKNWWFNEVLKVEK